MKKFSLVIIAIVVAGSFASAHVLGMPDVTTISVNCPAAQSILNQIQKADTGSRINRGHDYNEMLDLMFAMNARLSVNKIAAPALTSLALQFEQNLQKFRNDYNNYDDIIASALDIKCTNRPIDFYNKLEMVRAARDLLRQDTVILSQNIDNYYTEFNLVIEEAGRW
ncbi:hypothetical protein FWH58_00675 [Candidatus Saccharibacteria bacterium]|nr:hypothetical protein [Candidatus Saccharibacteria bacterium]